MTVYTTDSLGAGLGSVSQHFVRDTAATLAKGASEVVVQCGADNDYDGRIGLRVSAIFVILVGSTFGQ